VEIILNEIGEAEITRIVAAFYSRVRQDDLIGPLYPKSDWEGAEKRFRDFMIYRIGGSQRYIEERGHPRLRMRHMPFSIGEAERDRWLELMSAAMDETDVPAESRALLDQFFAQTADFMRNREE
jgi:hemoglobin